jgi:hypothetical protein
MNMSFNNLKILMVIRSRMLLKKAYNSTILSKKRKDLRNKKLPSKDYLNLPKKFWAIKSKK